MQDAAPPATGFAHFLSQTDGVGVALLAVLAAMSIAAWALIAIKGTEQWLRIRRAEAFLVRFWNARSLDEVAADLAAHGPRDPFSHLASRAMDARDHHAASGETRLADAGTESEFVARTLRAALDETATRMEDGLTTLATIGATAPFVGLFGTVWGIYHALLAIGASGASTLDQVAGPVGEALVMTAIGLAVAVPAVIAYNAIGRRNRVLAARLDAFAFELHTVVATGRAIGRPAADGAARPATAPIRAAA